MIKDVFVSGCLHFIVDYELAKCILTNTLEGTGTIIFGDIENE